jgi:hypothetical protein
MLYIGTGIIWGAVLLGVSFFAESEPGRNLDWELMWVIVGGFLVQTTLIKLYTKRDRENDQ